MIGRVLLLLGLAMALIPSASAQTGTCETGAAQRFVENSVLRASVFNTGALFFGGSTTSGDGYLIPKQSGTLSPIFAVEFGLGGLVDAEVRVAAARYGGWNFWPGPLEDAASPPQNCSEHDRIFVVLSEDIRQYYRTGELTDDLRDWPYQLGAPVIDDDGDPTNYNLAGGDQPGLIGDMAAWWAMNDAGNDHENNGSPPLGVEVRVHGFVYRGATGLALSPALLQTSFYRYEIVNRGDQPINSMYAMIYIDPDLGAAGDDYIGTDTLRNTFFVYNSDDEDSAYGLMPPALGVQVLQGPVGLANGRDDDFDGLVDEPGEVLGATATTTCEFGPQGTICPFSREHFYNYMQGLWSDGTPFYERSFGYGQIGAPITTFVFAGDPVIGSFWSAVNVDGNGERGFPGDVRGMISTGPFRLAPGDSTVILFAFPFGQGSSNLQSVAVMRGYATALQRLHAEGFFTSSPVERLQPEVKLALSRVRPNPSSGRAEVLMTLPAETRVRAVVLDALGRQLEVLVDGVLPEGETELAIPDGLAPGTYVLQVRVEPGGEETLTFTVAR